MTWAKFDDGFPTHVKVMRLSDAAFRLYVTAVCVCCRHGSDGVVDRDAPRGFPRAPLGVKFDAAVGELERAGLWDNTDDGWMVHDFLDWNPTAEEVTTKRAVRQTAGRLGGKRSAEERAKRKENAKQVLEQNPSKQSGKPEAKSNPVPVPVPVPGEAAAAAAREPEESTRVRCPIPVPIGDGTFSNWAISMGLPEHIARIAVSDWSVKQAAVETDLRHIPTWIRCAVQAIQGDWRNARRRAEMKAAAEPEAPEKPPDRVRTYEEIQADKADRERARRASA